MANVKDLIAQKRNKEIATNIELKDINKDLILSLFAVSLFGKDAHDEEILTIILGLPEEGKKEEKKSTKKEPAKKNVVFQSSFAEKKKRLGKELKKGQNGYLVHGSKIVLEPAT